MLTVDSAGPVMVLNADSARPVMILTLDFAGQVVVLTIISVRYKFSLLCALTYG